MSDAREQVLAAHAQCLAEIAEMPGGPAKTMARHMAMTILGLTLPEKDPADRPQPLPGRLCLGCDSDPGPVLPSHLQIMRAFGPGGIILPRCRVQPVRELAA